MNLVKRDLSKTLAKDRQIWYSVSWTFFQYFC